LFGGQGGSLAEIGLFNQVDQEIYLPIWAPGQIAGPRDPLCPARGQPKQVGSGLKGKQKQQPAG
jgi:hypothetical protein